MILKTGYKNSIPLPSPGVSFNELQNQLSNIKSQLIIARVIDIILNENHPKFKEVGEWNGIGTIYYEINNQIGSNIGTNIAKPANPQTKTYPLINELVILFNLPDQNIGLDTSNTSYYYLDPINIWNHPHHDAYPNLLISQNQNQEDYKSTDAGYIRRVTDESTEINLNSPSNPTQNSFVEKTNIHPLMPFMGDIIYEGRHGQSIRLGSTSKTDSEKSNNWSTSGENGDPITVLRNGQPKNSSSEGWIPITEDINNDLSSIYLTSTQKIPFTIVKEDFVSYTTPPTIPSQYISPQILFNSDRIILNAKNDSILLSGQKSVGLFSNESINLESQQIYIDGIDIKLGSKTAEEPLLLGNKTVDTLSQILTQLIGICNLLSVSQIFPGGVPIPDAPMNAVASNASAAFQQLQTKLDSLKSNIAKTK
jgi:hypothetical protein